MEWSKLGKEVFDILRLRTPPVGIFFSEKEDIPEGSFRPSKYGLKMAVCQAIGFARYSGRTVALTYDDFACPPAMVIYGLVEGEVKEILSKAKWLCDESAYYPEDFLPKGKYKTFIFGDMTTMEVGPEVVMVFGTPAQVGRLIQAVTYFGGSVKAGLTAKTASCSEALIPALNGEPAISVPGAGDRVFAGIDECEMVFSFPYSWMNKILEGLKNAGKNANVSYPVQPFLFFSPRFPKVYREIMEKFKRV
jgi:uncharacterized protein (DUF169 family)